MEAPVPKTGTTTTANASTTIRHRRIPPRARLHPHGHSRTAPRGLGAGSRLNNSRNGRGNASNRMGSGMRHQLASGFMYMARKLVGNNNGNVSATTATSASAFDVDPTEPRGMVPLDSPLMPYESGRKAMQANIRELRYTMLFWMLVGACAYFYWAGIVAHDTQFIHGYPRYGVPPAPNNFFSNRYNYEWAMVYILWFNALPIFLVPVSLSQMNLLSRMDIHYALTGLVFVANAFVFFSLSFIWIGFFSFFGINTECSIDSIGSDPQACGVFFGSSLGVRVCPNVVGCPGLTASDLTKSGPFFQHWLFSLVFNAWIFFALYMNQRLRSYGGWSLSNGAVPNDAVYDDDDDGYYDDSSNQPPELPPRDNDDTTLFQDF